LKLDPFDVTPRATDNIPEQIEMVSQLEKNGYTYIIEGDGIYMDTSKIETYGELM
jgi:cysteinyl-tRNA synthetase